MYKLFVLAAFLAIAAARPSHYESAPLVYSAHPTTYIEEPAYAKVGAIVKSIPTAVSHQSQSIVHSSAHVVEPIIAPVYKSYSAPLVHHSYAAGPVHYNAAPVHYNAAPVHYDAAPVHYDATPLVNSYGAAPVYKSYGAPLSYASTYAAPAHYSAW